MLTLSPEPAANSLRSFVFMRSLSVVPHLVEDSAKVFDPRLLGKASKRSLGRSEGVYIIITIACSERILTRHLGHRARLLRMITLIWRSRRLMWWCRGWLFKYHDLLRRELLLVANSHATRGGRSAELAL